MNRSTRPTNGLLQKIVETKWAEVGALADRRHELRQSAEQAGPARPFAAALQRRGEVALIAEFKRRSPSAGAIAAGDPAVVALAYESGGAAAVSVLTDGPHFDGSLADLSAARSAVGLPVLRKDFIVDELQLWEARSAGADAILLIVRILEDSELAGLLELSRELGLGVLVEVHDETELDRALRSGATVIGVNNRDLDTFRTDLAVTLRLAAAVPSDRILVGESGIGAAADVDLLGEAGVDAVLVGETLMRGAGVSGLAGRPKRDRSAVAVRRASSC